jgi:hypothetical protein
MCILKAQDAELTGRQTEFRRDSRSKPRAFRAGALLCLILTALLVVIQVAHVHPVESDPDQCLLCIAMHSAAPVAVVADPVVLVRVEIEPPAYEARAAVRYWHPKLFTRPPPTGC